MTYTILGTGNMAWFLGERFKAAGFICKAVYGRSSEQVIGLAAFLNTERINELVSLKDEHDFCLIALPDKEIEAISKNLSFEKTTVIHHAGALSIDILSFRNKAVLWPIYSIVKNNFLTHRNIPLVYEANNNHAKEIVIKIAESLSDILFEATEEQRKWLHVTAVFANNFTNHLVAITEKLCKDHNLPYSLMQPIIAQTFMRLDDHNAFDMQTGPAKRSDEHTIISQQNLLNSYPQFQKVYDAITTSIEDMYKTGR